MVSELPWIELAKKEIGTKYTDERAEKYFEGFDGWENFSPLHTNWCAAFVSWVLRESINETFYAIAAKQFNKYGIQMNGHLEYGSVVIFHRGDPKLWTGHIGFLVGNNLYPKYVQILGGNQSGSVRISNYRVDSIYKILWPRGIQRPGGIK